MGELRCKVCRTIVPDSKVFGPVLKEFLHSMSKSHERCTAFNRFMTAMYIISLRT